MWKNFQATVIQNFYRRFIKCSRDSNTLCKIRNTINNKRKYINISSPIDPIYRTAYDEKHHIRLVEWPHNSRKPCVWHFNILSLIEWLNVSKVWNNPMTNCLFLNKTIDLIIDFINRNQIRRKLKIPAIYNQNEPKGKKMNVVVAKKINGKLYLDLLLKLVVENEEEECFKLLHNNYDKISKDYFKIDDDVEMTITINNEKIERVGILHLAVYLGRIEIVNHLCYFGCDLEKKIGQQGYTALHLAAIMNNVAMGQLLKNYGADMMKECKIWGEMMMIFDICDRMGYNNFIVKILGN